MANKKFLSIFSSVVILTFLWSQCIWAIGLPISYYPPEPENQKNFSKLLHRTFVKDLCSNLDFGIETSSNTQENWLQIGDDITPFKPTGELAGYTEIRETWESEKIGTVPEGTVPIFSEDIRSSRGPPTKTTETSISNIKYDSLGRITDKRGTIDGDKYKYHVNTFDELGRPTNYKEVHDKTTFKHYGILYDSLGRVTEEFIRATSKRGTGIFKTRTKVLTEYKYDYDIHGNRTTTYEHEIYSKTSSNPIGKIVQTIATIAIACIPGLQPLAAAALTAFSSFAFNLMSGADFEQALLSAAISFAAYVAGSAVGGYLSGGPLGVAQAFTGTTGSSFFGNLTDMFTGFSGIFQTLSLIDTFVVDNEGRGLFEQIFGEWGATVLSGISIFGGLMTGGVGINGPPSTYQIFGAIGRMAVLSILTALGDRINSNLKQFLSGFFSQMFVTYANQETAQKNRNADIKESGMEFDLDKWGNAINIRLPEFVLKYANAKANSVATGGLSTILDIANALSASALQKEQKGFLANLKDNAGNALGVTKDFGVYLKDEFIFGLNEIMNIEVLPNRSRFDRFDLSEIDLRTQTGRAIYNAIYRMKYEKVYLVNLLNEGFVQLIGDKGIPNYDLPGSFEVKGKRFQIIYTNGVLNKRTGVQESRRVLQSRLDDYFDELGINTKVGYIHNDTYGPLDFPQTLTEYFGMVDDTSQFKAYYVNEIMKADPDLTMILTDHSQGGLKDDRTWDLIDDQYKDRICVITNGGAQIGGYTGAAAVINIVKVGDLVPVGSSVKALVGGPSNEYYVTLPTDLWYDWIPLWSLNNHPYGNNYNRMNSQIITRILTHDPDEDFNSIFKDLDYGNY